MQNEWAGGKELLKIIRILKKVKFAEKWMDLGSILDDVTQTQEEKSAFSPIFVQVQTGLHVMTMSQKKNEIEDGTKTAIDFSPGQTGRWQITTRKGLNTTGH